MGRREHIDGTSRLEGRLEVLREGTSRLSHLARALRLPRWMTSDRLRARLARSVAPDVDVWMALASRVNQRSSIEGWRHHSEGCTLASHLLTVGHEIERRVSRTLRWPNDLGLGVLLTAYELGLVRHLLRKDGRDALEELLPVDSRLMREVDDLSRSLLAQLPEEVTSDGLVRGWALLRRAEALSESVFKRVRAADPTGRWAATLERAVTGFPPASRGDGLAMLQRLELGRRALDARLSPFNGVAAASPAGLGYGGCRLKPSWTPAPAHAFFRS